MRLFVRSLFAATLVVLPACGDEGPNVERFTAALSGANEVPATATSATGTATFTYDGNTIQYQIDIAGPLDSITLAHIHTGAAGVNGGIVLNLFLGPTTGQGFNGTLVSGVTSIPSGITMDSVVSLMRAGNAYANVHTRVNGGGAIRGQTAVVQ
jgi:CHRD domain-containing protein